MCPRHIIDGLAEPQHHGLQLVAGPACFIEALGVSGGRAWRQTHPRRPAIGRRAAADQVRVQRFEHLRFRSRGPGYGGQRRSRRHLYLFVREGGIGDHVAQPEGTRVVAHDGRRQDLGNVDARLPRQSRFVSDQLPVIVGVVRGDRSQDRAVPGVVSGEHQVPGPEADVEILEVPGRRFDRPFWIAPGVRPVADLEAIGAGGSRHELPDPPRSHPRARGIVEAAFHHGHVEQITRRCLRRKRSPTGITFDLRRRRRSAVAAWPLGPSLRCDRGDGALPHVLRPGRSGGLAGGSRCQSGASGGTASARDGGERSSGGTSPEPPQLPGSEGGGSAPSTPPTRRSPGRGNASSSKRRISRSSGLRFAPTSSIGTPRTARRSDWLSSPGARVGADSRLAGGFACASPVAAEAAAGPNTIAEPESRPSTA